MRALILIDLQNDYGAFGAAPIDGSEQLVFIANRLMEHFDIVIASQDWHPANHVRFAANHPWRHPGQVIEINGNKQKLAIINCVQASFGAELMGGLNEEKIEKRFYKGIDPKWDSYSAFFDINKKRDIGLKDWLQSKNIKELYLLGLGLEKCVQFTVLDALELGITPIVIKDAVKTHLNDNSSAEKIFDDLQSQGALIVNADEILRSV